MTHGPQETGNLSAMVCCMVNDVQYDLPDGGFVRVALEVRVMYSGARRFISQAACPSQPILKQTWPVISEDFQAHVLFRGL